MKLKNIVWWAYSQCDEILKREGWYSNYSSTKEGSLCEHFPSLLNLSVFTVRKLLNENMRYSYIKESKWKDMNKKKSYKKIFQKKFTVALATVEVTHVTSLSSYSSYFDSCKCNYKFLKENFLL